MTNIDPRHGAHAYDMYVCILHVRMCTVEYVCHVYVGICMYVCVNCNDASENVGRRIASCPGSARSIEHNAKDRANAVPHQQRRRLKC